MAHSTGKAKSILSESFVENINSLNEDDLGALVVKELQKIRDLKEEMNNDERLTAAQQVVSDLKGGYTSVIKLSNEKIRYIMDKIAEIQGEGQED
jgi:hypothetical protein